MKTRISSLSRFFLAAVLLIAFVGAVFGRSMPERRVPLNDEVGLLDEQMAREVKRISQLLYRDLKSEMAVLIIRSTEGENAGDFALRVFNHWTLGQAGVDNGMLIMFAIDDRRVEIKPGIRYKSHFTEAFCTRLLTTHVVPEMKAGRPEQGVFMAAREVAAEIRRFEDRGSTGVSSEQGEAPPAGTVDTDSKPSAGAGGANVSSPAKGSSSVERGAAPGSSATSASRQKSAAMRKAFSTLAETLQHPIFKVVLYIIMGIWIAGGIFFYLQAFNHGRLMMNQWLFIVMMVLSGFALVAVSSQAFNLEDSPLDQLFAGGGAVSFLGFIWCFSHICPMCNKYMSVYKRTLRYATYYSTGLGEKTENCNNCGHHRVSTYTISRKTRSSSSSSSSSSSGGGGRSSGGGGGASW